MELEIIDIASYIGIIAFAISGALTGIRKEFDILGIVVLAILTVVGGGIIRDLLIGRMPMILVNSTPIIVIILVVILSLFCKLHKKSNIERNLIFVVSDSVGLVSFSIIGAMVAIDSQLEVFGVMWLAFATAVGGGIIRDIVVNEIPFIFKSDFYATIALLIAVSLYFLDRFSVLNNFSLTIVFVSALGLRIIAYFGSWNLPKTL